MNFEPVVYFFIRIKVYIKAGIMILKHWNERALEIATRARREFQKRMGENTVTGGKRNNKR